MKTVHEIVKILNGQTLINSESYQCAYRAADGVTLQPGFYLIFWPPSCLTSAYDQDARYFGPFFSRTEVDLVLRRSLEAFPKGSISGDPAAASPKTITPRAPDAARP
jgi:hypothetical protein